MNDVSFKTHACIPLQTMVVAFYTLWDEFVVTFVWFRIGFIILRRFCGPILSLLLLQSLSPCAHCRIFYYKQ